MLQFQQFFLLHILGLQQLVLQLQLRNLILVAFHLFLKLFIFCLANPVLPLEVLKGQIHLQAEFIKILHACHFVWKVNNAIITGLRVSSRGPTTIEPTILLGFTAAESSFLLLSVHIKEHPHKLIRLTLVLLRLKLLRCCYT